MANLQSWIVNPVLFVIVIGLTILFIAALIYQITLH
jgi:hypothetical protein